MSENGETLKTSVVNIVDILQEMKQKKE